MEAKLLAVLTANVSVSVTEVCAELGISRQTFYKYRRRFASEGPAGLVERSRRPGRSPQLMGPELEDEIVRLRKDLVLDSGARSIRFHLARTGWPTPSASAIHRALVRRGMVTPQPHKAPPSKGLRFEFPAPNAAWQIDATKWALADRTEVWVMDVLDDHSRLLIAALACYGPTGTAAWEAFTVGAARHGLPASVLSDNGTCFTTRLTPSGGEADFERNLRHLGINHRPSSPSHPQTCGKIERQHQTLKAWLRAHRPPPHDLGELQAQLDDYRAFYNHHRPHQALDGATPHERFHATAPDHPGPARALPSRAGLRTVNPHGRIHWNHHTIGIGTDHAGQHLLVIDRNNHLAIYNQQGLVRRHTIDPTRTYQPSGKPPGRPPRHQTT